MTKRPILTSLVVLGSTSLAHSALVTTFDAAPGNGNGTNVFTVSADGTATTASVSGNNMATSGDLGSATGSFTLTWTAEDGGPDGGGGRLPWDGTTFTGAVGDGWQYNGGSNNYGPNTPLDNSINLVPGEAIRMKFDLSSLTIAPGQFLRFDGINVQNSEPAGVFSFNDISAGTITQVVGTDTAVAGDNVFQPLNLAIEDGDEVAIWRPGGGGQVRTYGFTVSVVPEPSSIAMLGLGLGGLCLRRRRKS